MLNALTSLRPLVVLVVSVAGFLLGALWYSPLLFVKAWLEETKITPELAKTAGHGKARFAAAFACTVVSTFTLAILVAANRTSSPLKGAELGLLVGAGLVAARQGVNALFELRSLRVYLIVSGHDVALCVLQGALLAVWR
jgi:Protein of unknown function (DUF1761)